MRLISPMNFCIHKAARWAAMFASMLAFSAQAQNITISGTVRSNENGESLIKASVIALSLQVGTLTNDYGFYSLSLPQGADSVEIVYAFSGLSPARRKILPNANQQIDISLETGVTTIGEVVIQDSRVQEQLETPQMSVATISAQQAKLLPALFGEVDIIKTLQLKPGVQNGGEGNSGLYVRGGGPDQNLFLLDEATVYNPQHLFGFFSTFNTDAIKNVDLYKGAFPSQYGGRLSSVVDVRTNDGNSRKFSGSGGLGLISSRLTLEGPLGKPGAENNGSFLVSGRRTYVDLITSAVNRGMAGDSNFSPIPDYYFWDLNAKASYQLSGKDRLFLSGYMGHDKFGFDSEDFNIGFEWGNKTATLRWNHIFNPKLFMNVTATASAYDYKISSSVGGGTFSFEVGSGIVDNTGKVDFYWMPNNKHTIRAGINGTYYTFKVGRLKIETANDNQAVENTFNQGDQFYTWGWGTYVNDEIKVSDLTELSVGMRVSGFHHIDSKTTYWGWEPRAALRQTLTEKFSAKLSYARMYQYLNLVANSGSSLPTDIWFPSTKTIKPQISDQIAGGITFGHGDWLITDEVYYKWLQNQVDFRDGANLFVNSNLEKEFVFGKGWSYGNEFYIEKVKGTTTGWVGYTLSWNWRQFGESNGNPAINGGAAFHPRNDRRHDVSFVLIQQLKPLNWGKFTDRTSLSVACVYGTGNAVTYPTGWIQTTDPIGNPDFVPIYTDRNQSRLPAYHRLDVGIVHRLNVKWGESDITLSAYNTYNRRNPYFVYITQEYKTVTTPDGQSYKILDRFAAKQVSLFPIIPTVTWNFKF